MATEISSAGICAHRPSPTDSSEKCWPASANGIFCWTTPMMMPPMRLMPVISTPAMASPLTNLEAPSIAPKKSASRAISERRFLASSSVIRPVFRSASIAICLPGMASRVKRAATSATRPAPLVITVSWITIRIRKITRPTTTLPPTTKLPNAFTTWPASPCSRISRVTEMLIASRKSVVSSSRLGKTEKSSAFCT